MLQPSETFYVLDADNIIVEVGGSWRSFALENQADEKVVTSVVGTSVFSHIVGHFTRRFLAEFLLKTRENTINSRLLYRCDAPHEKRLMQMEARVGDDGRLTIVHRILEEKPLPFQIHVRNTKRGSAQQSRCSMCNRLKQFGAKTWVEPEAAFSCDAEVKVIHTVCSDCRNGVGLKKLEIGALKRAHIRD